MGAIPWFGALRDRHSAAKVNAALACADCLPAQTTAATEGNTRRRIDSGSKEGKMKNPPCQSARRVSKKLCQLFSSFLRGASCPKSPRVAATAATPFMPQITAKVKIFELGLTLLDSHRCVRLSHNFHA